MFDSLKKKLSKGVKKLSEKISEKPGKSVEEIIKRPVELHEPGVAEKQKLREEIIQEPEKPEEEAVEKQEYLEIPEEAKPEPERPEEAKERPILRRISRRVMKRELSEKDIDSFFEENEAEFLQANVALEVMDSLKERLKEKLLNREIRRGKAGDFVRECFEEALNEILNTPRISLDGVIKDAKSEGRPAVFVFLGFNGSGKTTTMAKLAHLLQKKGYKLVFAAADTFRAASIEQVEHHGEKLGIRVVKHKYGADPAAVVYDAVEHAKSRGLDVVMADTAGRAHTDKNLADELRKICRVNRSDLKILVLDSLTGNDIISQGEMFNEMAGVDAVILTKADVNTKGGAIMSSAFVLKKPILYLGVGQGYGDLEEYRPGKIARDMVG